MAVRDAPDRRTGNPFSPCVPAPASMAAMGMQPKKKQKSARHAGDPRRAEKPDSSLPPEKIPMDLRPCGVQRMARSKGPDGHPVLHFKYIIILTALYSSAVSLQRYTPDGTGLPALSIPFQTIRCRPAASV